MKTYVLVPFTIFGVTTSIKSYTQEITRPNIILIMTDQQRFDCMGVMGNPHISTPHMDALANDGALFTNAYTSTPSSTPARSALLTGNSPWKHGMLGYSKVAEEYPNEMPQMLRTADYYTFVVGKLHYTPQRNLHGYHAGVLDESGRIESADFVSDYRQWFAMEAPGLNPDSTNIGWNAHQGKDYALDEQLHPTVWTGNEAVRFIQNYKLAKSLFLKISFARPHSPYDPPKQYAAMYKNKTVIKPYIGDWCASFANRKETPDAAFGNFGEEHAIESRQYYYGAITFVDDQIGRIIEALKEQGMYDNSLIVFLSDHGDMLGDHYHWRKTYAYEGSSHIPFIVKPPKGTSYSLDTLTKLDHVVELRDVLPTFLEAAQIKQPKGMDGRSVLPLLTNKNSSWRPYIDMEHAAIYESNNYWAGLTDGKRKYIWFFRSGEEQLFDLTKDPQELRNLSNDEAYKKELELWHTRMIEHLSERGEPYVKNGELNIFQENILLSPNYPHKKEK